MTVPDFLLTQPAQSDDSEGRADLPPNQRNAGPLVGPPFVRYPPAPFRYYSHGPFSDFALPAQSAALELITNRLRQIRSPRT